MIMEEAEDPIASNFSTLAIYVVKMAGKSWYPECLGLPKTECVNVSLFRNVIFHNLPSSGESWDTGLGLKGLPYLEFDSFCNIFRCVVGGKVDC